MKKFFSIFMISLMLFACKNDDKKTLYSAHLNMLKEQFVINEDVPFNVTKNVSSFEDKYKVEIIYYNPSYEMKDFTSIIVDSDETLENDAPINVGYFNAMIDFTPDKYDSSDQDKLRFTFISQKENATYNILYSYLNEERVIGIFKI